MGEKIIDSDNELFDRIHPVFRSVAELFEDGTIFYDPLFKKFVLQVGEHRVRFIFETGASNSAEVIHNDLTSSLANLLDVFEFDSVLVEKIKTIYHRHANFFCDYTSFLGCLLMADYGFSHPVFEDKILFDWYFAPNELCFAPNELEEELDRSFIFESPQVDSYVVVHKLNNVWNHYSFSTCDGIDRVLLEIANFVCHQSTTDALVDFLHKSGVANSFVSDPHNGLTECWIDDDKKVELFKRLEPLADADVFEKVFFAYQISR